MEAARWHSLNSMTWLDHGEAIEAQDVRGVRLGELIEQARTAHLATLEDIIDSDPEGADLSWLEGQAVDLRRDVADPDVRYARVALVYEAAAAVGESTTKAVMRRFGVDKNGATTLVRRARDRGMLTASTGRGSRAGGTATDRARALVRRSDPDERLDARAAVELAEQMHQQMEAQARAARVKRNR